MTRATLRIGALLVFWCASCRTTPAGSPPVSPAPTPHANDKPSSDDQLSLLVEKFLTDTLAANPSTGRTLGLHEYDGKLAPVSQVAVDAELKRAREHLAVSSKIDLAKVVDPLRLDLQLTRLAAERTIYQLEVLTVHKKLMTYNALFDVSSYLVRDYAPIETRTRALLDHVETATGQVPALLAILDPKQPRTHLETVQKVLSGMREYYEGDVAKATAPALSANAELRARYEKVIPAGLAAVDVLLTWIEKVGLPTSTDEFALGEAKFLEMLKVNEGLRASLPDLEKMAREDYQRNYDAYVAVARTIDPKLSVRQVAAKVAADRLPKDAVINTAQEQLAHLLTFIESHDIITIGSEERATVAVTPPFMRWNSAFLDMAGPFETAKGSFYYISPPDPSWPAVVQESYIPYAGDLLATSIHEVYPGHFVQGLHVRRAATLAQKMLESYAFVEGWAHYTEEMMFEAGYGANDPRLELGQLSNALLRNCRFIAAIELHTKGMNLEEANRLFQDKCLIDPGNAIQQAYRGTFDPGYLSYTLGKLQIMDLRDLFFEKRGTKSLRAFHDWLLSFGSAPLALIRERLDD